MNEFTQGQVVVLKSDKSIKGAVIAIIDGTPEKRYQVFTNSLGVQVYYGSQLEAEQAAPELEKVDAERFQAGLTASLNRNPSLSSLEAMQSSYTG